MPNPGVCSADPEMVSRWRPQQHPSNLCLRPKKVEDKGFPTLPSADLCSCLIGQNWVTWPPLTTREAGKVDHRIIRIGLDQLQYITGAGNIAAQKKKKIRVLSVRKKRDGHWASLVMSAI